MTLAWRDGGARPPVVLAGRYELRELIGGGRSGLVHRAFDRRLGRVVALKTLRAPDPDALYRLKREFRTLARLAHPNLVSFFDLVVDGHDRFFTMELVDGSDFVAAYRDRLAAGAPPDPVYGDLRAAVLQLAAGLDALHRHGVLHRDVKPGNVLVARDGRVVLLDFGLALQVGNADDVAAGAAGTMGYLAPEQLAGQDASVASDWFGAGVMLYETLTGRMPYEGAQLLDVLAGRARRPTSPRVFAPTIPADLEALALALLDLDPARRPVGTDVVARLGPGSPVVVTTDAGSPPAQTALIGRDDEVVELLDALERSRAGACTLQLTGPSGIGKTALAETFARRARADRAALVLGARCHPHEAIPFKALDGAIDALARHLAALDDGTVKHLLPDDIAAVRRIFPVLGRVPRVARAVARGGADVTPAKGRDSAFAALRELLQRVAAAHPLVLWIDDAQCGDLDSAALLGELLRPPDPPRLLLLLSFRREPGVPSVMLDRLAASVAAQVGARSQHVLELGPLASGDAARLVTALLGDDGPTAAERIAADVQGSPLFALEVARAIAEQRDTGGGGQQVATPSLAAAIAARVARLPAVAHDVLELLAVAGRPIDRDVVRHALGADVDPRPALALLHARRFARPVPIGDGLADAIDHDRIRETVLAALSRERRRALHLALARALGSSTDVDPRLLVDHYEQAGETARAAALALAAAPRAAADLAFNQAAELYGRALALETTAAPAWLLHARIGRMLTFAGRAAEAARHLEAAADSLEKLDRSDPRRIDLRRRSAELYLRSGCYEAGTAALRATLAACDVRYPRTTATAFLSALARRTLLGVRTGLGTAERSAAASVAERDRLELYWSASVGLSLFDMIRAADFQLRHALLALRVDEPRHRARAFATEAMMLAWEGGARPRRRAEARLARATALAAAVADPRIEIQTLTTRAAIAFADRRFAETLALCERGAELGHARHVGTTWEMANLELCALSALSCMGQLARARARAVELLQRAHERGDLYSIISLRTGFPNVCWLGADDPDEARRQVATARAAAALAPFQDYCAVYAEVQVDLYAGNAERGLALARAAWPRFRRSFLLRIQGVRIDLLELRARCALACAAAGHRRRDAMLRSVHWTARRLARERTGWTAPLVLALEAGLRWQHGDRAAAIAALAAAATAFDRLDMRMHAAAARLHRERLAAGEQAARCADTMRELGADHPERLAAMLLPGFAARGAGGTPR